MCAVTSEKPSGTPFSKHQTLRRFSPAVLEAFQGDTFSDAATVCVYRERFAATIIEIWKNDEGDGAEFIDVQIDNVVLVSGSVEDGTAEYAFEPNENGSVRTYRYDGDKGWRHVCQNKHYRWVLYGDRSTLILGKREDCRNS